MSGEQGRHPKYPLCPPLAPQVKPGGFLQMTGRALVGMSSWRITGELPNVPKLIMLAAPHSSNWDGIYGILGASAIGLRATWMGKATLFQKPILGWLMRLFGGMAVDRSNPAGAVGQVAAEFAKRERMWVVLAPEGTRKKVPKWRTGFWHLARAANVPLFLAYFHYPEKRVGCGELFWTTDDMEADLERLYAFYAPWRGKDGKNALPEGRDTEYLRQMEPLERHSAGATVIHQSPFSALNVPVDYSQLPAEVRLSWVAHLQFGLRDSEAQEFLAAGLSRVDDALISQLLANFDWRARTVGAYLAAATHRTGFTTQLGRLLLRSDVCYAGRAYCIGLAAFNSAESVAFLNDYLSHYLTRPDLWFEQNEAMAGLAYLDRLNGTADVARHMDAWNAFVSNKPNWNLERSTAAFASEMKILNDIKSRGD